MRRPAMMALLVLLVGHYAIVPEAAASDESTPAQVAYGVGSALSTVVYAPFKAAFCILGGVGSVITLPFGGVRTAGQVVGASCRGTWVITPDVLKGKEPVRFVGDLPPADGTSGR